MLQYLITSKVRRRLLSLLCGEKKQGSVAELAELAGVAFAGAHVELKAMLQSQLVMSRREGAKDVYLANLDHPEAATLEALVASESRPALPQRSEDDSLRRKLVGLGAPLRGVESQAVPTSEQMTTLVEGANLARRDPVVARCMPLCFWTLRNSLDARELQALASRAEDKHAVGFFLEVAAELGGDRRLLGLAESFRDRRMKAVREFFQTGRHEAAREFELATKWGFRMNMDLDAFRSLFTKFAR